MASEQTGDKLFFTMDKCDGRIVDWSGDRAVIIEMTDLDTGKSEQQEVLLSQLVAAALQAIGASNGN